MLPHFLDPTVAKALNKIRDLNGNKIKKRFASPFLTTTERLSLEKETAGYKT